MNRLTTMRGTPKRIRVDNGPSSCHVRSIGGRTFSRSRSTSAGPACRPTMRWWSPSTNGCATSARTPTGPFPLTTPNARSKLGDSTIMRVELTHRWASFHPASLHNGPQGTADHEPGLLTRRLGQLSGDPQRNSEERNQWWENRVQARAATPRA